MYFDPFFDLPMNYFCNVYEPPLYLKARDILIPTENPRTLSLGPQSFEDPSDIIALETKRTPFIIQNPDLNSFSDQLRAWPHPVKGWDTWYQRVSKQHCSTWQSAGIADLLPLSLAQLEKQENMLKILTFFWSDALNYFLFGHAPMTPTLMDVVMITGLDITSSCPSGYFMIKCNHQIVDKASAKSWSQYIDLYARTKGTVDSREHTAFLNLWLDHFVLCGSSLAPTKNYLNLAYSLAQGNKLAVGKLLLGELYRTLSLHITRLLENDSIKGGGPWWFLQLWAQLYFQNYIRGFPSLPNCRFHNPIGKSTRPASFGQALYTIPGKRPDNEDAANWYRIFYLSQNAPLFDAYSSSEVFENPAYFRLDNFAEDKETRDVYAIMIKPCLLPVGMSTSNRITKPGYESYQPVIAARQLGLNQIAPLFIIHHSLIPRADLPDNIFASRAYSLLSDLKIPIPSYLQFTYTAQGFSNWWNVWKSHLFRQGVGAALQAIDLAYVPTAEELENGPEPTDVNGDPFVYKPTAPRFLFGKASPPLPKVIMTKVGSSSSSPSKRPREIPVTGPRSPKRSRKVLASKTPVPIPQSNEEAEQPVLTAADVQHSSSPQDRVASRSSPEEQSDLASVVTQTPSGADRPNPAERPDLAVSVFHASSSTGRPIPEAVEISSSSEAGRNVKTPEDTSASRADAPSDSSDPANLLSFDPSSLFDSVPATGEGTQISPAQLTQENKGRLKKALEILEAPVEELVKISDSITDILGASSTELPKDLQETLLSASHLGFFRARVENAAARINARRAQTSLKQSIAVKCHVLNRQKTTLDDSTSTTALSSEINRLNSSLGELEEQLRKLQDQIADVKHQLATKNKELEQIGKDKEILRKAMQDGVLEIQRLHQQIVKGTDEEDQVVFAEVDRFRKETVAVIQKHLSQTMLPFFCLSGVLLNLYRF